MADNLSPQQRSCNMSRIRSRDTSPEILVRSLLHRIGFRFRKHASNLPGKPDIVLPRYKVAICVHGCFWHRHKGCKRCTTPKTNIEYWLPKLEGNQRRDKLRQMQLRKLGYKVLVIWECETKNEEALEKKITRFFKFVLAGAPNGHRK